MAVAARNDHAWQFFRTPIARLQERFWPIVLAAAVRERPRFSPVYSMPPTANGVSFLSFFLSFRTPVAAKSWGGFPSLCAFFGHRRKALRTFLGPGLGRESRFSGHFFATVFSVGPSPRGLSKNGLPYPNDDKR